VQPPSHCGGDKFTDSKGGWTTTVRFAGLPRLFSARDRSNYWEVGSECPGFVMRFKKCEFITGFSMVLPGSCVYGVSIQKLYPPGLQMNLRTAQQELRSRSPHVGLPLLALEALVIVSLGMLLVGVFA
jgi:hypothetical protein